MSRGLAGGIEPPDVVSNRDNAHRKSNRARPIYVNLAVEQVVREAIRLHFIDTRFVRLRKLLNYLRNPIDEINCPKDRITKNNNTQES